MYRQRFILLLHMGMKLQPNVEIYLVLPSLVTLLSLCATVATAQLKLCRSYRHITYRTQIGDVPRSLSLP